MWRPTVECAHLSARLLMALPPPPAYDDIVRDSTKLIEDHADEQPLHGGDGSERATDVQPSLEVASPSPTAQRHATPVGQRIEAKRRDLAMIGSHSPHPSMASAASQQRAVPPLINLDSTAAESTPLVSQTRPAPVADDEEKPSSADSGSFCIVCPTCNSGKVIFGSEDGGVPVSSECKSCNSVIRYAAPTQPPYTPLSGIEDHRPPDWTDSRIRLKAVSVKILLDSAVAHSGGSVSGRIELRVETKTKVRHVRVFLLGREHCKFVKSESDSKPTVLRTGVLRADTTVWKNKSWFNNIDRTEETFPFELRIPRGCPPSMSFGARHGCWVEYRVRVEVDRAGSAENMATECHLTVRPPATDPNAMPVSKKKGGIEWFSPRQARKERVITTCGCCHAGHAVLVATPTRFLFALSERTLRVPVTVSLENETDAKMRSVQFYLEQSVAFYGKRNTTRTKLSVHRDARPLPMHSSDSRQYVVSFPLENALPSTKSRRITVSHQIIVKMELPIAGGAPTLAFPVRIVHEFTRPPLQETKVAADTKAAMETGKTPVLVDAGGSRDTNQSTSAGGGKGSAAQDDVKREEERRGDGTNRAKNIAKDVKSTPLEHSIGDNTSPQTLPDTTGAAASTTASGSAVGSVDGKSAGVGNSDSVIIGDSVHVTQRIDKGKKQVEVKPIDHSQGTTSRKAREIVASASPSAPLANVESPDAVPATVNQTNKTQKRLESEFASAAASSAAGDFDQTAQVQVIILRLRGEHSPHLDSISLPKTYPFSPGDTSGTHVVKCAYRCRRRGHSRR